MCGYFVVLSSEVFIWLLLQDLQLRYTSACTPSQKNLLVVIASQIPVKQVIIDFERVSRSFFSFRLNRHLVLTWDISTSLSLLMKISAEISTKWLAKGLKLFHFSITYSCHALQIVHLLKSWFRHSFGTHCTNHKNN